MELCYPTTAEQERVVGCIKECLSRVEEMQRLRKEALAESERLEERLLGEIEESLGGCRVPLGQLLDDTQNGKSLQNKETSHNGRALTLSAVRRHRLDLSASKPAQINRGCDEKYLVRAGDVFISRSNTRELVARSAIALERTGEPTIFSDLLIRLTPKPKVVRPFYLVIALRMPRVRHQLQSNAIGSSQTMVKISGERLRTVEIPCPSATEQECIEIKYAKADSAVSTIMDELSAQESELNFVRESILREAFAGNL